jgi:hypothetical protein
MSIARMLVPPNITVGRTTNRMPAIFLDSDSMGCLQRSVELRASTREVYDTAIALPSTSLVAGDHNGLGLACNDERATLRGIAIVMRGR